MKVIFGIGALLIILITSGIGVRNITGYHPLEQIECVSTGGRYRYLMPYAFGVKRFMCVYYFADGGKTCTSSDQCQGDCLVTSETELHYKKGIYETGLMIESVSGTGICDNNSLPNSCTRGTMENPSPEICY